MQKRPVIQVKPTLLHQFFDYTSIAILVAQFLMLFVNFGQLPEEIPRHISITGEISYSSKNLIIFLPMISLLMFAFLFYMSKKPHRFNYPKKITEENINRQYSIGVGLMKGTMFFCVLTFAVIQFLFMFAHQYDTLNYSGIIISLLILMLLIFIIYKTVKAYKNA